MPERRPPVAVFDIGGTSFRSAAYHPEEGLSRRSLRPAISYVNAPELSITALEAALIDYLVTSVRDLRAALPTLSSAAISLGAALDANTSEVLQAAPLWGPSSPRADLLAALRAADPGTDWVLLNDLTATIYGYMVSPLAADSPSNAHIGLLMIGSGIAFRIYDRTTGTVPVDPEFGVQGEVGHLTTRCLFEATELSQICDCGGVDHIGAFCSGRGIARVVAQLARQDPARFAESSLEPTLRESDLERLNKAFVKALNQADALALDILESVTLPISQLLLQAFTIDPLIHHIALTGGVVHAVGELYRATLLRQMSRLGLYQVSNRDPDVFGQRIRIAAPSDDLAMVGAGEFAPRADRRPAPPAINVGRRRWDVRASRRSDYRIERSVGLLAAENPLLSGALGASRCAVVCDAGFAAHHGVAAQSYFAHAGITAPQLTLNTTESGKNVGLVGAIVDHLDRVQLARRGEPVVAFGGGVLLDAVGFAAAIYRRGIDYIRVPTTLIALVDAGIGLKVGVNHGRSKNRLGSFYPPIESFLDYSFLRTLPDRHIRNGAAEILKLGIVVDKELFLLVEENGGAAVASKFQGNACEHAILDRAVSTMLAQLAPNPFESSLDRLVDFGHTFSPHIEMHAHDILLHGEAVAIDMAICTIISHHRGWLEDADLDRIVGLFGYLGLPIYWDGLSDDLLAAGLRDASLHRGHRQRVPLPSGGIGQAAIVNDISAGELKAALSTLRSLAKSTEPLAS